MAGTLTDVELILLQSYSKESVAHVQKYLTKNEVPTQLFEVCYYPTRSMLSSSILNS